MTLSAGFDEACAALEALLAGGIRGVILDEVSKARSFDRASRRLPDAMRAHRFGKGREALLRSCCTRELLERTFAINEALCSWPGHDGLTYARAEGGSLWI